MERAGSSRRSRGVFSCASSGPGEGERSGLGLDCGAQSAARSGGRGPSGAGSDEYAFEGPGDGAARAVGLAAPQHRLHGFQEFTAAGGGQVAQAGQVTGHPDDLPAVRRAVGVALFAQGGADADRGADQRLVQRGRVPGGVQDGVLPLRVPDSGRVAGP
ncbi:hypothetical protein SHIRM173S_04115 [Streptomyces hirsutus]